MILRCESCMGEVLCLDEEGRIGLIGATLIAKARGAGFEGKCWGCGHATLFADDHVFRGYLFRPLTEMPQGECLFYYDAGIFADAGSAPWSPEDTSLAVLSCIINTAPVDASPLMPDTIGLHIDDEGGEARLGSRPKKQKEEET